jgi:hypothetical protein
LDFESKIICKLGITNSTIKPPYILITRINNYLAQQAGGLTDVMFNEIG